MKDTLQRLAQQNTWTQEDMMVLFREATRQGLLPADRLDISLVTALSVIREKIEAFFASPTSQIIFDRHEASLRLCYDSDIIARVDTDVPTSVYITLEVDLVSEPSPGLRMHCTSHDTSLGYEDINVAVEQIVTDLLTELHKIFSEDQVHNGFHYKRGELIVAALMETLS